METKKIIKEQKNLDIIEGSVEDIIVKNQEILGVKVDKKGAFLCKSLVLTAGTFLRGAIKLGNESYPAGRIGDKPSINLAKSIEKLKFSIGRLKTGTPPRIEKKSINFNDLTEQHADKQPKPFSFIIDDTSYRQIYN